MTLVFFYGHDLMKLSITNSDVDMTIVIFTVLNTTWPSIKNSYYLIIMWITPIQQVIVTQR